MTAQAVHSGHRWLGTAGASIVESLIPNLPLFAIFFSRVSTHLPISWPLHPTMTMRRNSPPWGRPPWTIDSRPKLRPLPAHADFVVVGAGFAGLSAATWLAKLAPGKSVIVLESESIGHGASGRTGGMTLDQTARGPLRGLGDVLAGYKRILRALGIDSRLALPGAWELARHKTRKNSPISWDDSGTLGVVRKVPGGTVDPGKVVSGLARAAQRAGVQIVERAEVLAVSSSKNSAVRGSGAPLTLRVRTRLGRRVRPRSLAAGQVLLATNAASLSLTGLRHMAEPKLTFALATAPLKPAVLDSLGVSSRRPFYTLDMPYLWGRLLENNGIIFGSGLVPPPNSARSVFTRQPGARSAKIGFRDLIRFSIHKGAAAGLLASLESRVRRMHPALENVRVTHRWGGPILITKDFLPVFRRHAHNQNVLILAGFSGHGVALSVYLGQWAAQVLLGRRALPLWPGSR
jgi:glycine/D-amino acid oxidase-like deaminating enzyme